MKNYAVDFITNTVTISKKFAKAAENICSDEYKIMRELRDAGMQIVSQPPRKKSGARHLTYAKMEKYISICENGEQLLKDFESLKEAKSYVLVWKWFTDTFPDYNKVPVLNAEHKIIPRPNKVIQLDGGDRAAS